MTVYENALVPIWYEGNSFYSMSILITLVYLIIFSNLFSNIVKVSTILFIGFFNCFFGTFPIQFHNFFVGHVDPPFVVYLKAFHLNIQENISSHCINTKKYIIFF